MRWATKGRTETARLAGAALSARILIMGIVAVGVIGAGAASAHVTAKGYFSAAQEDVIEDRSVTCAITGYAFAPGEAPSLSVVCRGPWLRLNSLRRRGFRPAGDCGARTASATPVEIEYIDVDDSQGRRRIPALPRRLVLCR